jgi:aryl-alcohol dehydrogenase-like predicted oxidoreductase
MEYRVLGRSGLKVSVVAFGAAAFGGAGELALRGSVDLNTARRQIGFCLDAGVNLLDTANAYTRGKSEEILGAALLGKRDQVLVGLRWVTGRTTRACRVTTSSRSVRPASSGCGPTHRCVSTG